MHANSGCVLVIVFFYTFDIILCNIILNDTIVRNPHLIELNSIIEHHRSKLNQVISNELNENFLITDYLNEHEIEYRIHWRGKIGKEMHFVVDEGVGVNRTTRKTSVWQLTDGKTFVQMIYMNHHLMDCEYTKEPPQIEEFVEKFIDDYHFAKQFYHSDSQAHAHRNHRSKHNIYSEHLNVQQTMIPQRNVSLVKLRKLREIPVSLLKQQNIRSLIQKCSQLHKHLLSLVERGNHEEIDRERSYRTKQKRDLTDWFIAPNTKWCGTGTQAEKYAELGGASSTDKCCRKHDYCRFTIPGLKTKWGLYNLRPYTLSQCNCDERKFRWNRERRKKRDINDFFIFPDTKWCGKGWTANSYSEIGGYSKADRCCRQHDKFCPYWIGGLEAKYKYFNWRINTIMHCKCDERFRTCLKMADSTDANMVGKLFFNVVQTKCFVLKKEKSCVLQSYWGKCQKYRYRKRAYLRDNRKF